MILPNASSSLRSSSLPAAAVVSPFPIGSCHRTASGSPRWGGADHDHVGLGAADDIHLFEQIHNILGSGRAYTTRYCGFRGIRCVRSEGSAASLTGNGSDL